jgi:hypothetical protein
VIPDRPQERNDVIFKFVLSIGLLLGALTGLGAAAMTETEASPANQVQTSLLAETRYRVGDLVWIDLRGNGQWSAGRVTEISFIGPEQVCNVTTAQGVAGWIRSVYLRPR